MVFFLTAYACLLDVFGSSSIRPLVVFCSSSGPLLNVPLTSTGHLLVVFWPSFDHHLAVIVFWASFKLLLGVCFDVYWSYSGRRLDVFWSSFERFRVFFLTAEALLQIGQVVALCGFFGSNQPSPPHRLQDFLLTVLFQSNGLWPGSRHLNQDLGGDSCLQSEHAKAAESRLSMSQLSLCVALLPQSCRDQLFRICDLVQVFDL